MEESLSLEENRLLESTCSEPSRPRRKRGQERLQELLLEERKLEALGIRHIAGMDEVGRGPLAGPVVAACVVLPLEPELLILGVDDSKRLTPRRRAELCQKIEEVALGIGIGIVDERRIDQINILGATREAMIRAADDCAAVCVPEHVLVDQIPGLHLPVPTTFITKGDAISYSIAAASIVAKVVRDRMMVELEAKYPGYGFVRNMGYGTREHLSALDAHGESPVHRQTFLRKWRARR